MSRMCGTVNPPTSNAFRMMADHARQLERELAEAQERGERLSKELDEALVVAARLSASAPKSAGEWIVEVSHGCEQWVWKPAQRTESAPSDEAVRVARIWIDPAYDEEANVMAKEILRLARTESAPTRLDDPREDKHPPTKDRLPWLVQMIWDAGLYTHAREVQRLGDAYYAKKTITASAEYESAERVLLPLNRYKELLGIEAQRAEGVPSIEAALRWAAKWVEDSSVGMDKLVVDFAKKSAMTLKSPGAVESVMTK